DGVPFLRSIHAGPRPGGADGLTPETERKHRAKHPLRNHGNASVRSVPTDISYRNPREVAKSAMRLPAPAMTAAFACGMVIGLHPAVVRNAAPLVLPSSSLVTIVLLLLAAMLVLRPGHRGGLSAMREHCPVAKL